LKQAFNELHYALTVQWDQKDVNFYNTQIQIFNSQLRELQKQGISNKQMIEFLAAETKDEVLAQSLKSTFAQIESNKLSPEEVESLVHNQVSKIYGKGAGWNGEKVFIGAVITFMVIGIISLIVTAIKDGASCKSGPAEEICFYPNGHSGDYSVVLCEVRDPCTGELYSSRYL
jgi:hypothetical protein